VRFLRRGVVIAGFGRRRGALFSLESCRTARLGGRVERYFSSATEPARLARYTVGMRLSERIVVDPEILAGKPVIRGTRIAVEFILELLAAGQSENEILTNYPGLTREDILACLSYASYLAHEYKAFPIPA
jgi:uncharacterized protein (DUF433 family)